MGVGRKKDGLEGEGGLCCVIRRGLSWLQGQLWSWGGSAALAWLGGGGWPLHTGVDQLLAEATPRRVKQLSAASFPKGGLMGKGCLLAAVPVVGRKSPSFLKGWHSKASTSSWVKLRWETWSIWCSALSLKSQCRDVFEAVWNFKSALMKPFGLVISFSHPMNIKTCKPRMCKAGMCKLDTKMNSRHGELRDSLGNERTWITRWNGSSIGDDVAVPGPKKSQFTQPQFPFYSSIGCPFKAC